jgi:hypothetical protein
MARDYTDKQLAFLDALFHPEVKGDPRVAMVVAGYAPNTPVGQLMDSLTDEIIERAKKYIAAHSPKAAMAMVGVINDPTALGTEKVITAAKEILDRAGVVKKEKLEIESKGGGILLLPAKRED